MLYDNLNRLSSKEQSVLLFLNQMGAASISSLKRYLGMPKMELYPVLESLAEDGLVMKAGNEYVEITV